MESVLTKKQVKKFGPRFVSGYGKNAMLTAIVRYDDKCNNGHNSFAITGEIWEGKRDIAFGCLHEEIARVFPALAPFIKFHLFDSTGPMHYVANTVYWAKSHGPTNALVYFTDKKHGINRTCIKYCKLAEAEEMCKEACYTMEIDDKTAKMANLDHARSTAVWPEATDEELTSPGLKERLLDRLPALQEEFKAAVESLGFTY